jgi:hypothetical protein
MKILSYGLQTHLCGLLTSTESLKMAFHIQLHAEVHDYVVLHLCSPQTFAARRLIQTKDSFT